MNAHAKAITALAGYCDRALESASIAHQDYSIHYDSGSVRHAARLRDEMDLLRAGVNACRLAARVFEANPQLVADTEAISTEAPQ